MVQTAGAPSLYHKNLQPVTCVTGDVAGQVASLLLSRMTVPPLAPPRHARPNQQPDGDGGSATWGSGELMS